MIQAEEIRTIQYKVDILEQDIQSIQTLIEPVKDQKVLAITDSDVIFLWIATDIFFVMGLQKALSFFSH